jgi:hypothetical protein
MLKTNLSQKKSIIILIIIGLLILSFVSYKSFYSDEKKEVEQVEPLIDPESRQQMIELQRIKEERRGDDYEEPTEEERDADIERQIDELQELRKLKKEAEESSE